MESLIKSLSITRNRAKCEKPFTSSSEEYEWIKKIDNQQNFISNGLEACVVVDTTILLTSMGFVESLARLIKSPQINGSFMLIVPWSVVEEIHNLRNCQDVLSNGSRVGDLALGAVESMKNIFASELIQCIRFQRRTEILSSSADTEGRVNIFLLTLDNAIAKKFENIGIYSIIMDINLSAEGFAADLIQLLKSGKLPSFPSQNSNQSGFDEAEYNANLDKIVLTAFEQLIAFLPQAIQHWFEAAYGSDYDLLYSITPPWSVIDLIRMVRKHWMAVFSEHVPKTVSSDSIQKLEKLTNEWIKLGKLEFGKSSDVPDDPLRTQTLVRVDGDQSSFKYKQFRVQDIMDFLDGINAVSKIYDLSTSDKAQMDQQIRNWKSYVGHC